MIKKVLAIACVIIVAAAACAQSYKIIKLNSPKIEYKGKYCRVNDIIDDISAIVWSSDNDAIQLRDLGSNKMLCLTSKKCKGKTIDSVGSTGTKQLSSRELFGLDELVAELSDVPLFDTWEVYTMFPTTDADWFAIEYCTPDSVVEKRLRGDVEGTLYIDRCLFDDAESDSIKATIKYVIDGDDEVVVSDSVNITILNSID